MSDHSYIQWKNWNIDHFGKVSPGLLYYYSRIFHDKRLSDRCRILEIGFGNGSLLGYLRQTGHDISGVEVNEHLVERARTSGYKA
jgi:16S rRNA A1518/A1519 N6-dimethyltransferase RsmA/KsgA/DIM1 with predicted DNA glycosylase/AP lyase activity